MSDKGDKRVTQVEQLAASMKHWDRGPLSLAHEIRELLKPIADQGTEIDSGGGDALADLWVTVGGIEYHLAIKPSLAHLARTAN